MKPEKEIATLTILLVVGAIFAVSIIGSNYTGNFAFSSMKRQASQTASPKIHQPSQTTGIITYANLAQEMSRNQIVQALPTDASILLKFYRIANGQKILEKSYVIMKGKATEGTTAAPDITLLLPSYYLPQLTSSNFCSIIQAAKSNQDLTVQLGSSKLSLMWKYRSILGYRNCLGF